MRQAVIFVASTVYLAGAVFTFGLVYNRTKCLMGEKVCSDYKVGSGMLAGMFWPLAISAIVQQERKVTPLADWSD